MKYSLAYDNAYADYWSAVGAWNSQRARLQLEPLVFRPFPAYLEWLGREFVDGATLRSRFSDAWYNAELDVERTVELQAVRIDGDPSSSDHTFSTVKNIRQPIPGLDRPVKQVWDIANNKTGQVASAVCVTSVAAGEYVHAAHSLKIRRGTRMGTCFTDTWPSDEEVLRKLWDMSHGRLDIFIGCSA